MADNTQINNGPGDVIRDLDRQSLGVKTQVVQLDFGGADTNLEQLVSSANPLPVTVNNFPATTPVSGTVAVSNFPSTQTVSWSGQTVAATQSGSWTVSLSGTPTVNAVQSGSWTVTANQGGAPWTIKPDGSVWTLTGTSANANVTNFPATQAVTQSGSWTVAATQSGSWTVSATQSGTWTVTQSGTWTMQPGNTANTTPWLVSINQGGNTATVTSGSALRVDGSASTQPVSGSVSITGTATISGTVTANQGGAPWSMKPDGSVWTLTSTSANVNVTNFPGTQAVSGTVTANQGGAPWAENITQFGGVALSTGTGASGSGIPRVTVSNDSNVLATQSGSWTVAATQSGTWTTGRTWTLASGADSVTATISGNPADNIAQWGGTAVAAATAYGTAPSGNVGAVNAYITNTVPITGTIVTSAALAPNASQETGGNLNAIMVVLTQILLEIRALRMQDAAVHGQIVDPETNELAVTPSWN